MNVKELKEMITLMNENGLIEIEIEREGLRIRIKKGVSGVPEISAEGYITQPKGPVVVPQPVEAAPLPSSKHVEIKAPMVGTFYRAPAPDASPFIEVGQHIEAGQVVCILEAMKLMNEIKSEVKGKIVEVLVENAQPVEFGQVLFLVEPD